MFKLTVKKVWIRSLLVIMLESLLLNPSFAESDTTTTTTSNTTMTMNTPSDGPRLWNLQNADIQQVAVEVSRETGRNFILDPRVSGKISIISSTPIGKDEVYQMFLSMLRVLGYTIIPAGNADKIIPLSGSMSQSPPIADENRPGYPEQIVVRVIPLYNVSASKVLPILRPLIPENAGIAAYFPANALIVTSSAQNINRVMTLVADLDKANTSRIEVIRLTNSTASQVVSILSNMQADTTDESHVTLAADDHTNSIIMNGDMQGRIKMRSLIAHMDAPPPPGFEGNTQVVYLHYLQAAKFAPVLAKVAKANALASAGSSGAVAKDLAGAVNIQAEPVTNAVIITAPPQVMHNLESVVSRLDIRPAQVLIEAAVVELDESTLKQLGVQWGTINTESPSTINGGGTGNDSTTNGTTNVGSLTSISVSGGILPIGYNEGVGVIKGANFRAIISALAANQTVNLLSTPSIVVLDNQTAKIKVGNTLSIQTGQYSTTASNSNNQPFTTYDRQDIGLHLYVTPQINRGDAVVLKIDQGNQTLVNPQNPGTLPETNYTGLKTSVLVNTGDILVLGGLISNEEEMGEDKIPILGDIPGVGKLFQYHASSVVKRNLMIFLKPIILYNAENSTDVTDTKYNYIRSQQLRTQDKQPLTVPSVLPPSGPQVKLPSPFTGVGAPQS